MFGQIETCPVCDLWVLFEQLGENIDIEQGGSLRHQAAGSRKNCLRSKTMVSTSAIWSDVKPS